MYMHVAASCDVCAISCDVDKLLFYSILFSRFYKTVQSRLHILRICAKYRHYIEISSVL